MSKTIQVSIPAPCHESWDKMNPVKDAVLQKKFCDSCQKQVIDFTLMSDRQIAEFFKKPPNGSVCGRFMNSQLEKDLVIPKKRLPWVKYFFQILIPAFFTTRVLAQCETRTVGKLAVQTVLTSNDSTRTKTELPAGKKPITGRIMDEKGDNLPGASVRIKGTRTGVAADNEGQFQLRVSIGDVLIVSGAGLEITEQKIVEYKYLDIPVKRTNIICGTGIIVTAGMISVKRPVRKTKTIHLLQRVLKDSSGKFFKIFPNPALAGTEITIDWKETVAGEYKLELHNNGGQLIDQRKIWVDEAAKSLSFNLPIVTPGTYYLVIQNSRTKKIFTETMVIQ